MEEKDIARTVPDVGGVPVCVHRVTSDCAVSICAGEGEVPGCAARNDNEELEVSEEVLR